LGLDDCVCSNLNSDVFWEGGMENKIIPLKTKQEMTFGQVLRFEISRLGITQKQLAEKLGTSRPTINNLIRDQYRPSAKIVQGLARIFERPLEFWMKPKFFEDDLYTLSDKEAYGRLTDSDILSFIDLGHISVKPFDPNFLQPASLDLRAGSKLSTNANVTIDISLKSYWLGPNEAIRIETLETISLPDDVAGNIGGMGRHAKKFIFYGLGYEIDPGFNGRLGFTIRNDGIAPFRISKGMPIITVMFFHLPKGSELTYLEPKKGPPKNSKSEFAASIGKSIIEKFENSYHKTERQHGVIEYLISGTTLSFQTINEIENDTLFGMFLDEIADIHSKIENSHDEKGDEAIGYDDVWEFLDDIEISKSEIIVTIDRISEYLASKDVNLVKQWKVGIYEMAASESVRIEVLAHQLGVSSIELVLAIFDRL